MKGRYLEIGARIDAILGKEGPISPEINEITAELADINEKDFEKPKKTLSIFHALNRAKGLEQDHDAPNELTHKFLRVAKMLLIIEDLDVQLSAEKPEVTQEDIDRFKNCGWPTKSPTMQELLGYLERMKNGEYGEFSIRRTFSILSETTTVLDEARYCVFIIRLGAELLETINFMSLIAKDYFAKNDITVPKDKALFKDKDLSEDKIQRTFQLLYNISVVVDNIADLIVIQEAYARLALKFPGFKSDFKKITKQFHQSAHVPTIVDENNYHIVATFRHLLTCLKTFIDSKPAVKDKIGYIWSDFYTYTFDKGRDFNKNLARNAMLTNLDDLLDRFEKSRKETPVKSRKALRANSGVYEAEKFEAFKAQQRQETEEKEKQREQELRQEKEAAEKRADEKRERLEHEEKARKEEGALKQKVLEEKQQREIEQREEQREQALKEKQEALEKQREEEKARRQERKEQREKEARERKAQLESAKQARAEKREQEAKARAVKRAELKAQELDALGNDDEDFKKELEELQATNDEKVELLQDQKHKLEEKQHEELAALEASLKKDEEFVEEIELKDPEGINAEIVKKQKACVEASLKVAECDTMLEELGKTKNTLAALKKEQLDLFKETGDNIPSRIGADICKHIGRLCSIDADIDSKLEQDKTHKVTSIDQLTTFFSDNVRAKYQSSWNEAKAQKLNRGWTALESAIKKIEESINEQRSTFSEKHEQLEKEIPVLFESYAKALSAKAEREALEISDAKLKEVETKLHEKTKEVLTQKHALETQRLDQKLAKTEASFEHQKAIVQLKADNAKTLKANHKEHAEKIVQHEELRDKELAQKIEKHDLAMDKLRDENSKALKEAQDKFDKELKVVREELSGARSEHLKELNALREEHDAKLGEKQKEYSQKVVALRAEYEEKQAELKKESLDNLEQVQKEKFEKIEALQEENKTALDQLHEKFCAQIEEITGKHQEEIERLNAQLDNQASEDDVSYEDGTEEAEDRPKNLFIMILHAIRDIFKKAWEKIKEFWEIERNYSLVLDSTTKDTTQIQESVKTPVNSHTKLVASLGGVDKSTEQDDTSETAESSTSSSSSLENVNINVNKKLQTKSVYSVQDPLDESTIAEDGIKVSSIG